jgi:hypothetical protein
MMVIVGKLINIVYAINIDQGCEWEKINGMLDLLLLMVCFVL